MRDPFKELVALEKIKACCERILERGGVTFTFPAGPLDIFVSLGRTQQAIAKAKKEIKFLESHMCEGCRDDFYNGNNPMGIEKCWFKGNALTCIKDGKVRYRCYDKEK